MHLEKIEIQGFKSFANKISLVFPVPERESKGITAIVGPNGSGKSNVVDAVRWVLGEQSLKMLRGKKSEDVIFHGTEGKSRLGMAEVILHINNADKTIPLDYSEITIARRVYRNGESEYLLNKNKAKLSEIIMLLAKANFGQKSFSIVGQGMIDYILQAGFKERKEFFDEAVGVKQYQIKRNQTINNLNRTVINLDQINITLKELEPRLKLLSRQAKKLEKRRELKEKLTAVQISHYSNLYYGLKDGVKLTNDNLAEKNSIDRKISNELLELQKKMAVFANEHDRNDKFNELKNKFDHHNNQKNLLLKELTILKGEINIEYKKEGRLDLAWITKNRDELKGQLNSVEQNFESLETEEKTANKKIEEFKKELVETNKKIEEIREKITAVSKLDTEQSDKDWDSLLQHIIKEQQDLVNQIAAAKELEDFKPIKKKAQEIKEKLEQLTTKEDNKKAEEIAKKVRELTEEQSLLINKKNSDLKRIESLNINISITEERIKMAKARMIEIKNDLEKINKELEEKKPSDRNSDLEEFKKNEEKLNKQLEEIENNIKKDKDELDNFNRIEQEKKDKAFALQDEIQSQQQKLNISKNHINEILIEKAKLETKLEDLEIEIIEELENKDCLRRDKISKETSLGESGEKISKLKSQLEMIGGIDPETMNEYNETKERFEFLSEQVKDMEETHIKLEKIIKDLDKIIKAKFDESFSKINHKFNHYFKELFDGGEARLVKTFRQIRDDISTEAEEVVANEEQSEAEAAEEKKEKKHKSFEEMGIEIHAAPHGKKLKDINILSGGERSLTSIALICAIISTNPSPFVILDEVDAALDEANSVRFSKIIKNLSHKTQFITITHNRATMEAAKILYGITMQEKGVSKLLSISLEDAKEKAAR